MDGLSVKFQEIADPKSLGLLDKISLGISSLSQSIKAIRFDFPKILQVFGRVDVTEVGKLPPVEVKNMPDLQAYFIELSRTLNQLQSITVKAISQLDIKTPKDLSISNEVKIKNFSELLDGIEELKKGFNLLINKEKSEGPTEVSIMNYPPQMVPQPVTNISINPLRGFVHTTATSVTSTLTPLPSYGVLANRRAIQVYNNDSSLTLFIGGSDVTTSNGLPVPPNSYSPALDLGVNMLLYGVTSSGTANVRVLELSNDNIGG